MPPSSDHFEFDDQPPMMIDTTTSDVTDKQEQEADVEVGDDGVARKRQHDEGQEQPEERQVRRRAEQARIGLASARCPPS